MSTEKQERRKLRRFHDGWLHHKGKQDSSWTLYWVVLKEEVMFFFNNPDTSTQKDCRCLTIDGTSKYMKPRYKEKDKTYQFELRTAGGLENRFKCNKFTEREVWKAYVIGISTNQVSDDLDLLPGQIMKVKDDIHYFHGQARDSVAEPKQPRKSTSSNKDMETPPGSIDSKDEFYNGGPTVVHKFYNDPSRKDTPSWFFANIGRIRAEQILTQGRQYGNTLMRESARSSGSYSISKMADTYGNVKFDHFEVIRTAEHFKINVDNPHAPCKCLTDIMSTFIELSGVEMTWPMTSNNLNDDGFNDPDYQKTIGQRRAADIDDDEGFPPMEPPSSHDDEDTYEVPNSQDQRCKPNIGGPQGSSKTLTPGTINPFLGELQKEIVTKQHPKTVTGLHNEMKNSMKNRPLNDLFVKKDPSTTQALDHIDNVITEYEDDDEYVDEDVFQKEEHPLTRGSAPKRSMSVGDISLGRSKIADSLLSRMVTQPQRVPGLVKMSPPTNDPIVGAPAKNPSPQHHPNTTSVGRSNDSRSNPKSPPQNLQGSGHFSTPRNVALPKVPAPLLKHAQSAAQLTLVSATELESVRRPRQRSVDETSEDYYNFRANEPTTPDNTTGNMFRVITLRNVKNTPLPAVPGSVATSSPPVEGAVKKTPPPVMAKTRGSNENPSNAVPQSPTNAEDRPKSISERLAMLGLKSENPGDSKGEVGNAKFQQARGQQWQQPGSSDDEYYNDVIQVAPPPACDSQGPRGYVNCPPPKPGVNTGQVPHQGNESNFKNKLANIISSQATSPKSPVAPTKFPPSVEREDDIYYNIPYDDINNY